MKKFNIIDSHCHIYPEKIAQKATDSTDKFYGVTHAPFHGTTKELIEQSEKSGVSKMLVQSVATTENKFQA